MTIPVSILPAACPTAPLRDSKSLKKLRVVIVDDQQIEREVMRRYLDREPDVEIAGIFTNGRQAVTGIRELKPDLVFLDVQMPELNGFEVVETIAVERMPAFVFVTANEEFARRAFDVHALDYLLKPCRRDRLRIALQRAREEVRRRASRDESAQDE
jgi:two-component system LytT family response regulator